MDIPLHDFEAGELYLWHQNFVLDVAQEVNNEMLFVALPAL